MIQKPKRPQQLSLYEKQLVRQHKQENPTLTCNELVKWAKTSFGIKVHRTTILRILNDSRTPDCANINQSVLHKRYALAPPRYKQLDSQLYQWCLITPNLTGKIIQQQAREIAQEFNMKEIPKFSTGWLYGFKQRHGLQYTNWTI